MIKPRLLAPLAALILSLLFTLEASAYRPHSRVWSTPNATYRFTSNFSGFGAGWTNTAHDAANEWNNETDFTFSHNNNSQNTIDHGQLAAPYEDALAVTY